jgi:hypothetical protein
MQRFFRSSLLAACAALAALPGCNRDGRDATNTSAPAAATHLTRAPVSSPPVAPAAVGPVQEAEWFALQPRDWEPARTFNEDVERLNDNDPRAVEALARLREAWANAPVEPAMDGARIRIGGFIIPLDSDYGAVTELLLVPYYGACIHAPPPPANQVIHIFLREPLRNLKMMDAVHVIGTLRLARNRSPDNVAGLIETVGYEMTAEAVVPYFPEAGN